MSNIVPTDNKENRQPYILEETGDFAVVFKPPRMHCVTGKQVCHKQKTDESLEEWYMRSFPEILEHGGALVHRLDFETQGLVLFAKNKESFEYFHSLQEGGGFIKEYSAVCLKNVCSKSDNKFPGYPSPPVFTGPPFVIESFFRPFGPGRKQVRPAIDEKYKEIAKDRDDYYKTEVISAKENIFTLRIKRGFRHQIRCHLSWIGFPIQNDPLYGTNPALPETGFLALRAQALFFTDPQSRLKREYRITSLENTPFFVSQEGYGH